MYVHTQWIYTSSTFTFISMNIDKKWFLPVCEVTIITTYLIVALSWVVLNLPVMFLCLSTSQVLDMIWTALSSQARWSLTWLLCWPYTRMRTAPGSPSASWAGTLTDKKIKVKYGLRVGCTIVDWCEAEREKFRVPPALPHREPLIQPTLPCLWSVWLFIRHLI